MNRQRDRNVNALSKAPLLPSESSEDFESLYAALEEEIKPRGIIERLYLEDFAHIVWEIWRLRRCKSAIINRAFRPALQDLILQALPQPERPDEEPTLKLFNYAPHQSNWSDAIKRRNSLKAGLLIQKRESR
jgi:hypothetical protein